MTLDIKKGNLFDNLTPNCVIIHGCNAQGVMGSGFALEIKKRYPVAYQEYVAEYKESGLQLGDVIYYKTPDGMTICSAITQDRYGYFDGIVYVDYDAVKTALNEIVKEFGKSGVEINLPLIGGGLANGARDILIDIFRECFLEADATLWLI